MTGEFRLVLRASMLSLAHMGLAARASAAQNGFALRQRRGRNPQS
jgi:hypothetical protein